MRHAPAAALVVALVLGVPTGAAARNTFHDLNIAEALASELGKAKLLPVRVYFAEQSHGKVTSDLGVFESNRLTNAFGKADEQACRIAFLSAVIALQRRAEKEGGNAVVGIKSVTRDRVLVSDTQYRCVAGNVVANVALSGRVVRIDE